MMSKNHRFRFSASTVFYGRAMAWTITALTVLGMVAGIAARGWAQEPTQQPQAEQRQQPTIKWQVGPTTGKLGDIAEISIPEGYAFADKDGAIKILQMTENIPSGRELGVVVSKQSSWFMIFEFRDSGYVKDDEGSKLDAQAILKSLQEGTDEANSERAKHGWKPIHVAGWQRAPYYDPQTHNLTWATLVRGDDPQEGGSVNHEIRILGRRGTMDVDLIASPTDYASLTGTFNTLISGFHYTQGNRYSDFAKGDKVAEYGLTALILGGGAAVALKTGLLAKFWKFIVMGIVAIGAAIKKLFQKIFGKEEKIENPNEQAASQGQ
jgi:uncharacterized membrane-anchored protein